MDFILEMFARDNPDEWSFQRNPSELQYSDKMLAWERALTKEMFQKYKLWPNGKPVIPVTTSPF